MEDEVLLDYSGEQASSLGFGSGEVFDQPEMSPSPPAPDDYFGQLANSAPLEGEDPLPEIDPPSYYPDPDEVPTAAPPETAEYYYEQPSWGEEIMDETLEDPSASSFNYSEDLVEGGGQITAEDAFGQFISGGGLEEGFTEENAPGEVDISQYSLADPTVHGDQSQQYGPDPNPWAESSDEAQPIGTAYDPRSPLFGSEGGPGEFDQFGREITGRDPSQGDVEFGALPPDDNPIQPIPSARGADEWDGSGPLPTFPDRDGYEPNSATWADPDNPIDSTLSKALADAVITEGEEPVPGGIPGRTYSWLTPNAVVGAASQGATLLFDMFKEATINNPQGRAVIAGDIAEAGKEALLTVNPALNLADKTIGLAPLFMTGIDAATWGFTQFDRIRNTGVVAGSRIDDTPIGRAALIGMRPSTWATWDNLDEASKEVQRLVYAENQAPIDQAVEVGRNVIDGALAGARRDEVITGKEVLGATVGSTGNNTVDELLGMGVDIATDLTTYTGFGLVGRAGRLAENVPLVGKPIRNTIGRIGETQELVTEAKALGMVEAAAGTADHGPDTARLIDGQTPDLVKSIIPRSAPARLRSAQDYAEEAEDWVRMNDVSPEDLAKIAIGEEVPNVVLPERIRKTLQEGHQEIKGEEVQGMRHYILNAVARNNTAANRIDEVAENLAKQAEKNAEPTLATQIREAASNKDYEKLIASASQMEDWRASVLIDDLADEAKNAKDPIGSAFHHWLKDRRLEYGVTDSSTFRPFETFGQWVNAFYRQGMILLSLPTQIIDIADTSIKLVHEGTFYNTWSRTQEIARQWGSSPFRRAGMASGVEGTSGRTGYTGLDAAVGADEVTPGWTALPVVGGLFRAGAKLRSGFDDTATGSLMSGKFSQFMETARDAFRGRVDDIILRESRKSNLDPEIASRLADSVRTLFSGPHPVSPADIQKHVDWFLQNNASPEIPALMKTPGKIQDFFNTIKDDVYGGGLPTQSASREEYQAVVRAKVEPWIERVRERSIADVAMTEVEAAINQTVRPMHDFMNQARNKALGLIAADRWPEAQVVVADMLKGTHEVVTGLGQQMSRDIQKVTGKYPGLGPEARAEIIEEIRNRTHQAMAEQWQELADSIAHVPIVSKVGDLPPADAAALTAAKKSMDDLKASIDEFHKQAAQQASKAKKAYDTAKKPTRAAYRRRQREMSFAFDQGALHIQQRLDEVIQSLERSRVVDSIQEAVDFGDLIRLEGGVPGTPGRGGIVGGAWRVPDGPPSVQPAQRVSETAPPSTPVSQRFGRVVDDPNKAVDIDKMNELIDSGTPYEEARALATVDRAVAIRETGSERFWDPATYQKSGAGTQRVVPDAEPDYVDRLAEAVRRRTIANDKNTQEAIAILEGLIDDAPRVWDSVVLHGLDPKYVGANADQVRSVGGAIANAWGNVVYAGQQHARNAADRTLFDYIAGKTGLDRVGSFFTPFSMWQTRNPGYWAQEVIRNPELAVRAVRWLQTTNNINAADPNTGDWQRNPWAIGSVPIGKPANLPGVAGQVGGALFGDNNVRVNPFVVSFSLADQLFQGYTAHTNLNRAEQRLAKLKQNPNATEEQINVAEGDVAYAKMRAYGAFAGGLGLYPYVTRALASAGLLGTIDAGTGLPSVPGYRYTTLANEKIKAAGGPELDPYSLVRGAIVEHQYNVLGKAPPYQNSQRLDRAIKEALADMRLSGLIDDRGLAHAWAELDENPHFRAAKQKAQEEIARVAGTTSLFPGSAYDETSDTTLTAQAGKRARETREGTEAAVRLEAEAALAAAPLVADPRTNLTVRRDYENPDDPENLARDINSIKYMEDQPAAALRAILAEHYKLDDDRQRANAQSDPWVRGWYKFRRENPGSFPDDYARSLGTKDREKLLTHAKQTKSPAYRGEVAQTAPGIPVASATASMSISPATSPSGPTTTGGGVSPPGGPDKGKDDESGFSVEIDGQKDAPMPAVVQRERSLGVDRLMQHIYGELPDRNAPPTPYRQVSNLNPVKVVDSSGKDVTGNNAFFAVLNSKVPVTVTTRDGEKVTVSAETAAAAKKEYEARQEREKAVTGQKGPDGKLTPLAIASLIYTEWSDADNKTSHNQADEDSNAKRERFIKWYTGKDAKGEVFYVNKDGKRVTIKNPERLFDPLFGVGAPAPTATPGSVVVPEPTTSTQTTSTAPVRAADYPTPSDFEDPRLVGGKPPAPAKAEPQKPTGAPDFDDVKVTVSGGSGGGSGGRRPGSGGARSSSTEADTAGRVLALPNGDKVTVSANDVAGGGTFAANSRGQLFVQNASNKWVPVQSPEGAKVLADLERAGFGPQQDAMPPGFQYAGKDPKTNSWTFIGTDKDGNPNPFVVRAVGGTSSSGSGGSSGSNDVLTATGLNTRFASAPIVSRQARDAFNNLSTDTQKAIIGEIRVRVAEQLGKKPLSTDSREIPELAQAEFNTIDPKLRAEILGGIEHTIRVSLGDRDGDGVPDSTARTSSSSGRSGGGGGGSRTPTSAYGVPTGGTQPPDVNEQERVKAVVGQVSPDLANKIRTGQAIPALDRARLLQLWVASGSRLKFEEWLALLTAEIVGPLTQ